MEEAAASTEDNHVTQVVRMGVAKGYSLFRRAKPLSFAPTATQAVNHGLFNAPMKARQCAATRSPHGNADVGSSFELEEPQL